jgi:hypothetical protein
MRTIVLLTAALLIAAAPDPQLVNWLFADEDLAQLVQLDPEFAQALASRKNGDTAAARQHLLKLSTHRETRIRLAAWHALHALGVRPPAAQASMVRGVVCQLHNEAGVGTIAGYEDGSARWFGGKGSMTFWEPSAGNADVDAAIRLLLASGAPLVKTMPLEHHDETLLGIDRMRVTVLTDGGIHVTEVYGPTLKPDDPGGASLVAAARLLRALTKATKTPREVK